MAQYFEIGWVLVVGSMSRIMPVSIIVLLVGDLRRSGRLKKRVRFTFPTLFAKKTNYLYTRLWNFKKLQRIQIQLAYRYVRLRTNNLEKLSRFPKTSGILRTQHIQSCRAFLVSFEKSNIYIYNGIIFFTFQILLLLAPTHLPLKSQNF